MTVVCPFCQHFTVKQIPKQLTNDSVTDSSRVVKNSNSPGTIGSRSKYGVPVVQPLQPPHLTQPAQLKQLKQLQQSVQLQQLEQLKERTVTHRLVTNPIILGLVYSVMQVVLVLIVTVYNSNSTVISWHSYFTLLTALAVLCADRLLLEVVTVRLGYNSTLTEQILYHSHSYNVQIGNFLEILVVVAVAIHWLFETVLISIDSGVQPAIVALLLLLELKSPLSEAVPTTFDYYLQCVTRTAAAKGNSTAKTQSLAQYGCDSYTTIHSPSAKANNTVPSPQLWSEATSPYPYSYRVNELVVSQTNTPKKCTTLDDRPNSIGSASKVRLERQLSIETYQYSDQNATSPSVTPLKAVAVSSPATASISSQAFVPNPIFAKPPAKQTPASAELCGKTSQKRTELNNEVSTILSTPSAAESLAESSGASFVEAGELELPSYSWTIGLSSSSSCLFPAMKSLSLDSDLTSDVSHSVVSRKSDTHCLSRFLIPESSDAESIKSVDRCVKGKKVLHGKEKVQSKLAITRSANSNSLVTRNKSKSTVKLNRTKLKANNNTACPMPKQQLSKFGKFAVSSPIDDAIDSLELNLSNAAITTPHIKSPEISRTTEVVSVVDTVLVANNPTTDIAESNKTLSEAGIHLTSVSVNNSNLEDGCNSSSDAIIEQQEAPLQESDTSESTLNELIQQQEETIEIPVTYTILCSIDTTVSTDVSQVPKTGQAISVDVPDTISYDNEAIYKEPSVESSVNPLRTPRIDCSKTPHGHCDKLSPQLLGSAAPPVSSERYKNSLFISQTIVNPLNTGKRGAKKDLMQTFFAASSSVYSNVEPKESPREVEADQSCSPIPSKDCSLLEVESPQGFIYPMMQRNCLRTKTPSPHKAPVSRAEGHVDDEVVSVASSQGRSLSSSETKKSKKGMDKKEIPSMSRLIKALVPNSRYLFNCILLHPITQSL